MTKLSKNESNAQATATRTARHLRVAAPRAGVVDGTPP